MGAREATKIVFGTDGWRGILGVDPDVRNGYDDIKVEPRLNTTSQRRADVFYADRSAYVEIHHYTDDVVVRRGVSQAGVTFLAKPYTSATLMAKVREALAARPSS